MPKRLLIVAYYYPPLATSGAMRPLAMTRFLPAYGWQASVVTVDPASAAHHVGLDAALEARIPPGTDVLRVPHGNPIGRLLEFRDLLRRMRLAGKPTAGASAPQRGGGSASRPGLVARVRESVLERLFGFPDACAPWLRPAIRGAEGAFATAGFDAVLATAPPWTTLLVGSALARRFGAPLVLDFRDPWTANPIRRTRSGWAERKARAREAAIVRQASLVITNTDESRKQLTARYPEFASRFITLTNGFDPETAIARVAAHGRPERPIEFSHFGTVYGQRSPLKLLKALDAVTAAYQPGASPIRVRFIGGWEVEEDEANTLARALEARGVITREPSLSHQKCLEAMADAPFLLALQPGSPLQIPGKLYEYIATGRPLLVVGGEGATSALVERYNLGLCVPDETSRITAALEGLVGGDIQLHPPSSDDVKSFDYRELTKRLASALEALPSTRR